MCDKQVAERELYLGQFIPLHYHFQMLDENARMGNFKAAIDFVTKDGAKVVDLGAGTGVMSHFAAQKASKVYSVERNPVLSERADQLLRKNGSREKVELIKADAFKFLPPEPVDVVICEMLHSGLLQEKQVEVIKSFKERYQQKFGSDLPIFIPCATVLGFEPIQANFDFHGYNAPIPLFEAAVNLSDRFVSLGDPIPYAIIEYGKDYLNSYGFQDKISIEYPGRFNALRFHTKNVLAIDLGRGSSFDWWSMNLLIPLDREYDTEKGDSFSINFRYEAGALINTLEESLSVSKVHTED